MDTAIRYVPTHTSEARRSWLRLWHVLLALPLVFVVIEVALYIAGTISLTGILSDFLAIPVGRYTVGVHLAAASGGLWIAAGLGGLVVVALLPTPWFRRAPEPVQVLIMASGLLHAAVLMACLTIQSR